MDYMTRLPKAVEQHDSVMVIMDRLTKVAHFVLVKSMFLAHDVEHVFI